MTSHDPHASAVGRAILGNCIGQVSSDAEQRQTDVLSPTQISRRLAALANEMDELSIQIGYHINEPWADFRNELASGAHVVRRRADQIGQ